MNFYELNLEQMNTGGLVLVHELTWAPLSMHLLETGKVFFPFSLTESQQNKGEKKAQFNG